ncbi:hypothetical protein HNY73_012316 [Argiope bruennichi]|uniref:Uncharacterized protein n=1 Tax=Argiope bruennichi TaxID=94029 RepID=A0A8T0EZB2_ARGBR|nr:hypothetical protein HNY73_012316 [Argiope bruennichi]
MNSGGPPPKEGSHSGEAPSSRLPAGAASTGGDAIAKHHMEEARGPQVVGGRHRPRMNLQCTSVAAAPRATHRTTRREGGLSRSGKGSALGDPRTVCCAQKNSSVSYKCGDRTGDTATHYIRRTQP